MSERATWSGDFERALDRDGYVVVAAALDPAWVERLRRAFEPAPLSGTQHVEINDATPEIESWRALESHPTLVAAAEHILSRPFCLTGLHGRNPLPGYGQQGLHTDYPRQTQDGAVLLTALWMLDDFLAENGATRVVPGSHRIARPIAKDYAQPLARHPDEKVIIGRAGDVLLFDGYLWHSGRRNDSNAPRRAVQMSLRRGTPSDPMRPLRAPADEPH